MIKKVIGVIFKFICFLLAKIIYRVKIIGIENVPKDSPAIICGNHVHGLDAPILVATTNRKIRFMAKEELFQNFWFRIVASIYGVFPVSRGKKDTDAIKKSLKVLKANEILGMYPEGTRNGMQKGLRPKNGAVNIAIRAGVPIIPFGVHGNFKPFRKITYRFGEPMDFSEYKDKAHDKEFVRGLTKQVMDKVVELRDYDEKSKNKVNDKR